MLVAKRIALMLVICGLAPACKKDVDERLGLDEKKKAQGFDPTSLDRNGELEKALSTPAADIYKKLGPHRLVESAKMALAIGDKKDTLDETWRYEIDSKGASHLLRDNSHGYGFESYSIGDSVYVRPRYGRFIKRVREGDEVERGADQAEQVLAGWMSVLGRFAERKDEGEATMLGRPARKITLSLASSPRKPADGDPAWRKTMTVSALKGEVVVDTASGAALHATLEASYTAPREEAGGEGSVDAKRGEPRTIQLNYRGDVEALGEQVAAVTAPADAAPTPLRPRPLVDRQTLLDGLVTPPSPAK